MKKRTRSVIILGVLLSSLFLLSGCSQSQTNLAVDKNWHSQFVSSQHINVEMYDMDASFPDALGYSSAEPAEPALSNPLPPEIIKLILTSKGSIGNLVWDDDGDGIFDPGESGVAGVRVFVDLNGDTIYSIGEPYSITDDNGMYKIPRLKQNTYLVHVDDTTLESGYVIITNHPLSVTVVKNSKYEDADFGIQNRSASISGYICNDSAEIGCNASSPAPIPGVNVYVDINNDDEYTLGEPFGTTDATGYYQIQQLQAGTFKVHVDNGTLSVIYHRTPVSGTNPTTVTLTRNQPSTVSFGYIKKVTISGILRDNNGNTWGNVTLFIDLNGNGVYDKGEPITKTDIYGRYMFDNLYPGTYTIMVMRNQLPGGYDYTLLTLTLGEGINHTVDLLLQTQSKFTPVNTLRSPTRLSWGSNGNLYVSDNSLGSVFIFDSTLTLLNELKGLQKPLGVNTDSSGNIYVGTQGSKSVIKYDSLGNYLQTFGKGNIDTPNDITFDRANNIYIMDSGSDTVLVYNQAGTLLRSIGNPVQLDYGVSIAIHYRDDGAGGEIGELYVADLYKKQVVVFSLQGDLERIIGGPATGSSMYDIDSPLVWEGYFVGLKAIDFDQNGILHTLDAAINVVSMFDPVTGIYLGYYNAFDPANATKLNLQVDINIDSIGRTFQGNTANKQVELINPVQ